MTCGEKIKKLRLENGLTQEDLASKIYVSRTLITKYETGQAYPTKENLEKLAIFFKVDLDYFIDKNEQIEINLSNLKELKYLKIFSILLINVIFISYLIFSFYPFYRQVSYDYSNVTIDNPIPLMVVYYIGIFDSNLRTINPFYILFIIFFILTLVLSVLYFLPFLYKKAKRIILISIYVLFLINIIWLCLSFAFFVSSNVTLDF